MRTPAADIIVAQNHRQMEGLREDAPKPLSLYPPLSALTSRFYSPRRARSSRSKQKEAVQSTKYRVPRFRTVRSINTVHKKSIRIISPRSREEREESQISLYPRLHPDFIHHEGHEDHEVSRKKRYREQSTEYRGLEQFGV